MCAICEHRPVKAGHRFCANCESKIDKERRSRQSEKAVKFATWRGHVIGFYRSGGVLRPRLLQRKPDGLPKGQTINLDVFCEGFTRPQVQKIKAAIHQLTQC